MRPSPLEGEGGPEGRMRGATRSSRSRAVDAGKDIEATEVGPEPGQDAGGSFEAGRLRSHIRPDSRRFTPHPPPPGAPSPSRGEGSAFWPAATGRFRPVADIRERHRSAPCGLGLKVVGRSNELEGIPFSRRLSCFCIGGRTHRRSWSQTGRWRRVRHDARRCRGLEHRRVSRGKHHIRPLDGQRETANKRGPANDETRRGDGSPFPRPPSERSCPISPSACRCA